MPKNYVDLRLVLSYDKDENGIRWLKDAKVKVSRVKGLTAVELECLAEIFGTEEDYQELLYSDSIEAMELKVEEMSIEEARRLDRSLGTVRP